MTYSRLFIISLEAYSYKCEEFANRNAYLFALLNAAAVPDGDFGSTPNPKKLFNN